jgi:dTMP kinase
VPKGLFISFEGIDSSGKKTQASLLAEYLKKRGFDVVEIGFPAYHTVFGSHVAAFLRGEYGKKEELPAEVAALLFAVDRYQFKENIRNWLREGKIIVCNRYTQSAMAFEGTLNKDKEEFIKWVGAVESRLPQPDIIFLLDMPTSVSRKLLEKREGKDYLKGKDKDVFEEDLKFQEAVRQTYLELSKGRKWVVIECFNGEEAKTIEEVHGEVVKKVENILIKKYK